MLLCLLLVSLYSNLKNLFGGVSGRSSLPARAGVPRLQETILEDNDSTNKLAVIEVDGIITSQFERGGYTMVELIQDQLKVAERDKRVKAVILKVNSPGGEVLASDDINKAIKKFQDDSGKPVVVSMGSLAASGGYYVSAPCRWIVANELTITGSIGVIMSTYNYRGLMDKIGHLPGVRECPVRGVRPAARQAAGGGEDSGLRPAPPPAARAVPLGPHDPHLP